MQLCKSKPTAAGFHSEIFIWFSVRSFWKSEPRSLAVYLAAIFLFVLSDSTTKNYSLSVPNIYAQLDMRA